MGFLVRPLQLSPPPMVQAFLPVCPPGQWWVSVGTDKLATIHSMPAGATEFQVHQGEGRVAGDPLMSPGAHEEW